jgi:hypothetical protein
VHTLIQEKKMLEIKLATVNLVLELKEEHHGVNNVCDSDGDGSHAVVDDDDNPSDEDGSQVVDDDGDISDDGMGQLAVDDNNGEFLNDDDGDRKQQPRSLHDNVESANPHYNGDSGSHHSNWESTSLHSNREMGIHHDNGETVSLHGNNNHRRHPQQQGVHSNRGNQHRHQQQAGVQRVHGKTSWGTDKDTGMEEEEDEGKDNVEADSTENVYGDDDE